MEIVNHSNAKETESLLLLLPIDILLIILEKLKIQDILNILRTCKLFNNNFKDEQSLWKHKVIKVYSSLKKGFKDLCNRLDSTINSNRSFNWKQHLVDLYRMKITIYVAESNAFYYLLRSTYTDCNIEESIYDENSMYDESQRKRCCQIMTIGPIKNANLSLLLQWVFIFHYGEFGEYCLNHLGNGPPDLATLLLTVAHTYTIDYQWASIKNMTMVGEKLKRDLINNIANNKQEYIQTFNDFISIKSKY